MGLRIQGYEVVIERGPQGYGAFVPELPGCVAAAQTREEVEELIRQAIDLHLDALDATAMKLKGKLDLDVDLDVARERDRC
jgi:predicted RNase H-like HicB family nuclease